LFERFPEIVAPGTASRFSQWHGLAMVREPSPKNGTWMVRKCLTSPICPGCRSYLGLIFRWCDHQAGVWIWHSNDLGRSKWHGKVVIASSLRSTVFSLEQHYPETLRKFTSFGRFHFSQHLCGQQLLWWFWLWLSILELYAAMVDSWLRVLVLVQRRVWVSTSQALEHCDAVMCEGGCTAAPAESFDSSLCGLAM
jgi:hypothetical protein